MKKIGTLILTLAIVTLIGLFLYNTVYPYFRDNGYGFSEVIKSGKKNTAELIDSQFGTDFSTSETQSELDKKLENMKDDAEEMIRKALGK